MENDRDAIIARARDMVPALSERAAETEALRRIPDETLRAFREAGFYRVMQPARYGGSEMPFGTHTDFAIALAHGCASSAWDACVTACHAWALGMFPPESQDEVWGDDPTAEISTSFRSIEARAVAEGGGVRASGRWAYSSGVDHCRWVLLTMAVEPESGDGPPDHVLALLPLDECRIDDVWRATGLAGTGSNDVVVEDRYIPPHRILRFADIRGGPTPGSAVNDGYLYRLPLMALFSFNLIGVAVGAAQGICESVIGGLAGRRSRTGAGLAEQQSVQLRVSEATAEADAAHAVVARNMAAIVSQAEAGALPDIARRARYRRDNAFAARLCVAAADRLYPLLGAAGVDAASPVNRAWRDVHAAAQHIALIWDVAGTTHGAIALGLPSPDPRL